MMKTIVLRTEKNFFKRCGNTKGGKKNLIVMLLVVIIMNDEIMRRMTKLIANFVS